MLSSRSSTRRWWRNTAIIDNMAQAFGKTWWGSEWLKALTHIDYANRIPRGSAYARKGAVRSIEVKENVIFAKVSGSRPTPYKVTIKVPTFSQTA